MAAKRIGKKFLKITGISFGILLVLLIAFHFWFVAHAGKLLENLVESKSHGTLKLKVEKFKFSYFSNKMEVEKAVFYNTDTLTGTTSYHFSVERIKLQVKAIWPIIFKKQILIDSLSLIDPDIVVTVLRASVKNDQTTKKDVSIPEEMGKIYNTIQKAIQVLEVKRFEFDNARFTLINKTQPDQLPVTISRLFFHINNFQVDKDKLTGKEKFLFGDNAVLRTRDQDILFPDGRHRLSFSRFRINLRKKLVEFDSCTIAATKSDSSAAGFKVFFDVLLLTNIDFDTLYRNNVIKADSVYCVNPQFNLDAKWNRKKGSKKTAPELDKIIQELTGDMQLGFVIVNNASFNINIERNGIPSSFTSDHNNFEIRGFSVDKGAAKPLTIKSFAMAIRNYENFLRDSSYSMQFDSILFNNDRIFLSNFTLRQLNQGKTANSFRMPQFELMGLSWDELVFNHRLKAQEATLYHPLIDYTVTENRRLKNKNQNIFDALGSIGRIMQLDELNIVEGQIDLTLKGNTQLQLKDATLSVQSHTLFSSREISTLKHSINELHFSNGTIKTNDLNVQLNDVHYTGNDGSLLAGKIVLLNRQKTISVMAQNVSLNEMLVNDSTGNIQVNAIQWKQADVKIITQSGNQDKISFASSIDLKNINGSNTTINITIGERSVTSFLKTISLNELLKQPEKKLQFENLFAEGKKLKLSDKNSLLSITDYRIEDGKNSLLQNISYISHKEGDSVNLTIPLLTLVPHIHDIIDGKVKLDDINIVRPAANVKLSQPDSAESKLQTKLPWLDINKIAIQQPEINFSQPTKKGTVKLEWNGLAEKNNLLELTDLITRRDSPAKASIKDARFTLNHFIFTGHKGKTFDAGNGEIAAQLKNINAEQTDNRQWNWSSVVEDLSAKNFRIDSLGKSAGKLNLDNFKLGNLSINSVSIGNLGEITNENSSLQLKQLTGQYNDLNNHFGWFNAGYDQRRKSFSVDSFSFHPTLDQDAFIAGHPFETDFVKVNTGKITFEGIDPSLYFRDSILNIHSVTIDDVVLSDFRDKRPPFKSGIIKPMPVQMIKNIPFKLSIDSILLNNANTTYAELNEKTNETGTIPVTRMTVKFFPVRNYNLSNTDSLRIQANGYLMDSIWIRLRVRESYTDSLSGFLMTLRIKPADLLLLNPVLVPLSSIKLQSGFLDTLSMRAVGKEYLSFGEMEMFYHDLKVKFLKKGSETKKSFLTSLITFVANSFVVKNKNTSRKGRVFFLRLRDRSILNYLVKIALSGMASSAGARSNRKILRKYKKELRLRNLPPFDYD